MTAPAPVPRRRVFHVHHRAYHFEDSQRGILTAIRLLFGWIDLDCHVTGDGVLVITHWPRPMIHDGFVDPGPTENQPWPKVHPRTTVEELTWEQVSRLRTRRRHYRISRADRLVPIATNRGLNVELEMKSLAITSAQLVALRTALGTDADRVQVKALPQFVEGLEAAHDADYLTLVLSHGHAIPKDAQEYINYHRGPVHWI